MQLRKSFFGGTRAAQMGREVGKPAEKTIAVRSDVHKRLLDHCARKRQVLKDMASDVLDWYVKRADVVQTAIFGVDSGLELAYADVLEAMAKDLREQHARDMKISEHGVDIADGASQPTQETEQHAVLPADSSPASRRSAAPPRKAKH